MIEIIKTSKSKSEAALKMGYQANGSGIRKINKLISEHDIDISHFSRKRKYELIIKECPICGNKFEAKKGHKKEKKTCSHGCANTYFRSGVNNPNYINIDDYNHNSTHYSKKYRDECFKHHEHKCCICDEIKILDVHHFDGNRKNNKPDNLIPICPTHHNYYHSKYRNEVKDKIIKYRVDFKNK